MYNSVKPNIQKKGMIIVEETKKKRQSIPAAIYPEKPTRIVAIDSKYIKDYLADNFKNGNISRDEMIGWQKLYNDCVETKGERGYFQEYRKQFVKAYFPELVARIDTGSKKESMGDFISSLLG